MNFYNNLRRLVICANRRDRLEERRSLINSRNLAFFADAGFLVKRDTLSETELQGNKRRRLCNLTSNTLAPNPVEEKYFLNYLEGKTAPIISPAATEFHLLSFNARHPNEKLLPLSSHEQLNSSFLIGWKHSPTWLPKDRVMGIKFRDQRFPHGIR